MNLDLYRGHDVEKVKQELENLGFVVSVNRNSNKSTDASSLLVVHAKQISEKEIVLICGDFTFLS